MTEAEAKQPMATKLEGIRKRAAHTERDLKESGAVTWLTAESDRAYLLRLVDAYRELDAATHDANIAVADPVVGFNKRQRERDADSVLQALLGESE